MEELINNAITLGLKEICFTDHVDYGVKLDWDEEDKIEYRYGMPMANVDYPRYFQMIRELQEKYNEKLTIRIGMEFGMQVHTIPKYRTLFEKWDFDFIILSCHQIDNKEFYAITFTSP